MPKGTPKRVTAQIESLKSQIALLRQEHEQELEDLNDEHSREYHQLDKLHEGVLDDMGNLRAEKLQDSAVIAGQNSALNANKHLIDSVTTQLVREYQYHSLRAGELQQYLKTIGVTV